MEPNETIKKLIEESGEMWADVRDRTASPVLVKLDGCSTFAAFELSLPKGEAHPFWRVSERDLTPDEQSVFEAFRRNEGYGIGDLMCVTPSVLNGTYYRVRGFIFNGRRENGWDKSIERAEVEIREISAFASK